MDGNLIDDIQKRRRMLENKENMRESQFANPNKEDYVDLLNSAIMDQNKNRLDTTETYSRRSTRKFLKVLGPKPEVTLSSLNLGSGGEHFRKIESN